MPDAPLPLPSATRLSGVWRYAVSLATVAAALLLSELLRPLVEPNPFLFVFGAIALSAGYGGLGPGLLATALALLGINYLFIPPAYAFSAEPLDLVRLGAFAFVSVLVSGFSDARRGAVQATQRQREQLQVTLASIGDAVIATDTAGRVTFLNGVAATLTGWTAAEAEGQPIDAVFRIVNADTRTPVESPVRRVLREGRVVGLANHTTLLGRDGVERPIDDSSAPIQDSEGQLIGVVLVFRDVTEREQGEAVRAELLSREQLARAAAERAREQLAFLAEAGAVLSSSLDYQATLQHVAALAVPRMGDWCAVDVLGNDTQLERLAVVHPDPSRVALAEELHRRYPPNPAAPGGTWQVIRTGEPILIANIDDAMLVAGAEDANHLTLLRKLNMGAALVVPLLAGERVLGALTLVMAESGRRYGEEDREVALSLGRRAGLAIEKAQLYTAEQRARLVAEQLADRLGRLQTVTAALAAAPQPEDVARVVTEQCVQAFGAKASAVMSYDPASRTLQLLHAVGYGAVFHDWERIPIDEPYPFNDVVRDGTPIYVSSHGAFNMRYPALAATPTISEAAAYLPLLVDGQAIGAISIGFATAHELDGEEQAYLETLAMQCAQALDRARLFAAEQEARAAAEEAVTLRDQFLSVASHELKTPLTSLLLQTQLLQRRVSRAALLAEREQRALQVVSEQAQRLDQMVTSLLDISRLELGQLSLNRTLVDLPALAQRVVAEVQPTTEAHAVTCTASEDGLLVDGDALRLEQVLQNLLQNAIKYSPNGGPVEVVVSLKRGHVCVTVSDRGIGFPAEAAARLFERFYRAPNADPRQISGLGIGLYVVQEIVRMHGGSVWAESQEEGGSCFTVCLPQAAGSEGA